MPIRRAIPTAEEMFRFSFLKQAQRDEIANYNFDSDYGDVYID